MRVRFFLGPNFEIIKDNDKYFIICDSGGIGSCDVEAEVTEEEALRAVKSQADAHAVLIAADARKPPRRVT